MADTASDTLVGRAPTSPCDFYVVDGSYPCGRFTRALVGSISTLSYALQGSVDIAATATMASHATAIRAVVSEASGATMTSALVAPLSIETYIVDAPALHVMMRFNTDASKDTPDAWFTGNAHSVACTTGSNSTTLASTIRVKITGSNLTNTFGRIRVYQDA